MLTEHMLRQRAEELFNSTFVPAETNVANREKWVKIVLWLGPRWRGFPQPYRPPTPCNDVSTSS